MGSVLLSSFPKMDVEMLVPELWWKIFSYMSQTELSSVLLTCRW